MKTVTKKQTTSPKARKTEIIVVNEKAKNDKAFSKCCSLCIETK